MNTFVFEMLVAKSNIITLFHYQWIDILDHLNIPPCFIRSDNTAAAHDAEQLYRLYSIS
jgi:hypothetical protein